MIEEQILKYVETLGFPIIVCLWFMFRTEKIIKSNTEVLNKILVRIK